MKSVVALSVLALSALSVSAHAQDRGGYGPFALPGAESSQVGLLIRYDVASELRLTPNDTLAISRAIDRAIGGRRPLFNEADRRDAIRGERGREGEWERRQRPATLMFWRQALNDAQDAALRQLNPWQKTRLAQISIQALAGFSLQDKGLRDGVGLNRWQEDQVVRMLADEQRIEDSSRDPYRVRREFSDRLLDLLDRQQKRRLTEIAGRPFTLDPRSGTYYTFR